MIERLDLMMQLLLPLLYTSCRRKSELPPMASKVFDAMTRVINVANIS